VIDRTSDVIRNAPGLAAAIEALGVSCSLETRDGLALVIPLPDGVTAVQSAETRRALVSLARRYGFTHVAMEVPADGRAARSADASVSRD
jgi:hypothetical protein